jgi:hypothetical protein
MIGLLQVKIDESCEKGPRNAKISMKTRFTSTIKDEMVKKEKEKAVLKTDLEDTRVK